MKGLRTLVGLLLPWAVMTVALDGTAQAAVPKHVVVSGVTVTAAKAKGQSAVVMSIANGSGNPISLLSVTSTVSTRSMVDYDDNMCQGGSKMTPLANILIMPSQTQLLGYRYQGAMLSGLRRSLSKGESIPLVLTWSDFQAVHRVTVIAKVVAPPKGLRFLMSPMKM